MRIKPLKRVWCVVGVNGYPNYDTISYAKKYSINKFIDGSTLTWKEWQEKYKVDCIRLNILFYKSRKTKK